MKDLQNVTVEWHHVLNERIDRNVIDVKGHHQNRREEDTQLKAHRNS